MAEDFANLVAKVTADNRDLEKGMRESEQIVKASANKMQASIATVGVGFDDVTRKLSVAREGFGSLRMGVAMFGSQTLGTTLAVTDIGMALSKSAFEAGKLNTKVGSLISSIGGLTLGLAAASVGVVVFREEIAALAIQAGVALGILDDLDAVLTRSEATGKRLEGIRTAQERRDAERLKAKVGYGVSTGGIGREQADVILGMDKVAAHFLELTRRNESAKAVNAARDAARKADELRMEQNITQEFERRKATLAALRESQADRNRALAQQIAILAGRAKPSQFVENPQEAALMRLRESLGLAGGSGTPEGGSFRFGTRAAEGFRFGAPTGTEKFGAQTETAKQTDELKKQTAAITGVAAKLDQLGFSMQDLLALN